MPSSYHGKDQIAFNVCALSVLCALSIMGTIWWLIYSADLHLSDQTVRLPSELETAGSIALGYFLTQVRTIFEIKNVEIKNESLIKKTEKLLLFWWPAIGLFLFICVIYIHLKPKYPEAAYPLILFSWLFMVSGGYIGVFLGSDNISVITDEIRSGLWLFFGAVAFLFVAIASATLLSIPVEEITKNTDLIPHDPYFELIGGSALGYFFAKIKVVFNIFQKQKIDGTLSYMFIFVLFLAFMLVIILIGTFIGFYIRVGTFKASSIRYPPFFQAWVFSSLGFMFGSAGDAIRSIQESVRYSRNNNGY